MRKYIGFVFCFLFIVVFPMTGISSEKTADLLAQYKEDIKKIEDYVNGISTISGKFTQYSSKGGSISGNFYLSRPGKMRLDYDFPVQYRLIANDDTLVYYDKKLDQTNYLDMKNIPLSLLLSPNVSFAKLGMDIPRIEKDGNEIAITVKPKVKGFGGYATLVFGLYPVRLKKWSVVDAQNIRADVVFESFNHAIVFDDDFFKFDKPQPKKKKKKNNR